MNSQEVIKALNWRYAVKAFDPSKKITSIDWSVLSESLRLSPSSYGLQPWKFIVVQNSELRKKLREYSWNQTQVTDCSHLVVFTYKKKMDVDHIQKFINKTSEVRGVELESLEGYKNMMISDLVNGSRAQVIEPWAQRQTYIAMGFLMETAALLNIDSCPLEGLSPQDYDRLLGLEGTGWGTVAAVALGYRSFQDKYQNNKKVRFDTEQVIEFRN